MTAHTNEWLTVAEACAYLKITRATLYRWAREGRLRLFKAGRRTTRVSRDELNDLLKPAGGEQAGWSQMSEDAFARGWDNEKDAAYDNWRDLYGVRNR